ncbi:MAG TPA: hypothetical protein DHM37_07385 [Candidatus Cloacimonas sp.]|jgi:hypothetical protein|nr:hypothetical protein [Candidatus Cloacimonas sp.]
MNKKNLISLGILIVLVIVYIFIKSNENTEKRVRFFQVDSTEIAQVVLQNAEDTLKIAKQEGTWQIIEPLEYPAAENMTKALFESVLTVETSKTPIAESKASHAKLNVTDSLGTLVSFWDDQNNQLQAAYVGRNANYNYANARNKGENKVYQLLQNITYNIRPSLYSWRSKTVLNIPQEQISQIEVAGKELNYQLTASDSLWIYSSGKQSFGVQEQNSALKAILNGVSKVRATNFVDNNYQEYAEKFKNPQFAVKIHTYEGSQHVLSFIPYQENKYLMQKDDLEKHLFVESSSVAKIFQKTAEDYKK